MKKNNILESSGFVPSLNNSVILTNKAVRILDQWISSIQDMADPDTEIYKAPSIISQSILKTGGYLDHFPHQLMKMGSGNTTPHILNPAVCFHVYNVYKDQKLNKSLHTILVDGNCFRGENGVYTFPFRLASFRMIEYVLLGSQKFVEEKRKELREKIANLFQSKNLRGTFINATDAFFLGESEGAKILQQLKELKQEYTISTQNNSTALASINYHEQYFGKKFNIRLKNNSIAYSVCVAFGIERIIAAQILCSTKL